MIDKLKFLAGNLTLFGLSGMMVLPINANILKEDSTDKNQSIYKGAILKSQRLEIPLPPKVKGIGTLPPPPITSDIEIQSEQFRAKRTGNNRRQVSPLNLYRSATKMGVFGDSKESQLEGVAVQTKITKIYQLKVPPPQSN